MKYRKRTYYTEEQKALMWDRWQEGDSIHDIARLFDRYHSSVQGIFARCGGIRPRTRRRSARSLTLAEREEISRGIAVGRSLRSIALRLGRAPSTVSREGNVTAVFVVTGQVRRMKRPGIGLAVRRSVNWQVSGHWPGW